MQQPPHLKAIVPLYATDDRYTDDCHYTQGGNLRMYYDVGVYGGFMVVECASPYPELAGSRWADIWKQRLEQNGPYLLKWVKHQVDGPYWRHGSLRPNYDLVKCPAVDLHRATTSVVNLGYYSCHDFGMVDDDAFLCGCH